jgi:hypothetical protein
MSTVAFGSLATRREQSDSGTSTSDQPPGMNSYIDVLAALVPAEVLAIHALIIATLVNANSAGQTRITDLATLRWAFWLLAGLAAALFVLGRRPVRTPAAAQARGAPRWQRWEWQDFIRLPIPALAFAGWTMLEPASVWNAVVPGMSSGMRMLIPMVGAVLLAAVTKALASHSDKKLSASEQAAQAAQATPPSADQPAPLDQPPRANQLPLTEQPAVTEQPAPPEYDTAPPALAAGSTAIESVPKWVY